MFPGFQNSRIPEKKNLGFPGIPGIPGIPLKTKVADSTGIPGKKVADSNWDSGSQLGICTPLGWWVVRIGLTSLCVPMGCTSAAGGACVMCRWAFGRL